MNRRREGRLGLYGCATGRAAHRSGGARRRRRVGSPRGRLGEAAADGFWAATTALLLVPLTISVVRSLLQRDVGVDAIALVSMAGALALGEYLAGAVVALMLAGGNALEERANRRAARELTALVERAPRTALVRRGERAGRGAGRGRRAPATAWSCARARSSRSTGWSRARRRWSTSRR